MEVAEDCPNKEVWGAPRKKHVFKVLFKSMDITSNATA
jgi:hypothetical protein